MTELEQSPPKKRFTSLRLKDNLLQGVANAGYETMTPVQQSCLPAILASKNVIVGAKTGSGKTAAFALGILNRIQISQTEPQALVLCPTRELAAQVAKQIRLLGSAMPSLKVVVLCGGEMLSRQADTLSFGAHIIVATPGRLADHLTRRTVYLGLAAIFVLDEADRMLDMGFEDDLNLIESRLAPHKQTMLFSATFSDSIESLAGRMMSNPVRIMADDERVQEAIEQIFYRTKHDKKTETLLGVLGFHQPENALVFCTTKLQTEELKADLLRRGINHVHAIHGDLDQREREEILTLFSNRSCSLLIATDVAARGLDLPKLDMVINYDLSKKPESHVHRVGRTGRSGKTGIAASLITDRDSQRIGDLEAYCRTKFEQCTLDLAVQPAWIGMAPNITLKINAGKKNKMRKADILGALTAKGGLRAESVGQISIHDFHTFVAVSKSEKNTALKLLNSRPVKARNVKAQEVGEFIQ